MEDIKKKKFEGREEEEVTSGRGQWRNEEFCSEGGGEFKKFI